MTPSSLYLFSASSFAGALRTGWHITGQGLPLHLPRFGGQPGFHQYRSRRASSAHTGYPRTVTALPSTGAVVCQGRYKLKRLLGAGDRKRVYLAEDRRMRRDVAFSLIEREQRLSR